LHSLPPHLRAPLVTNWLHKRWHPLSASTVSSAPASTPRPPRHELLPSSLANPSLYLAYAAPCVHWC
jgi:hypothetical protein